MLVTERMQALGDHARSSRQPPLKERRPPNAIESAAEQNVVDETILENGTAHESVAAPIIDDAPPENVVRENGNGPAIVENGSNEDAGEIATAASVAAETELQPTAADDSAMQAKTVQEDADLRAAKRAIIHEWENWSALHSDELGDPKVAEYFFTHLETKKPQLLNFGPDDRWGTIRRWVTSAKH